MLPRQGAIVVVAAGTVVVVGGTVRGGATVWPVVMSTAHVLITQSFTFSAAWFDF